MWLLSVPGARAPSLVCVAWRLVRSGGGGGSQFSTKKIHLPKKRYHLTTVAHKPDPPAGVLPELVFFPHLSTMAPLTYGLGLSVLALLHLREGADAFVQPSAALLGSRRSASVMSMTSDGPSSRGGFLVEFAGGVGVGVLGLGLATERATAYEVCTVTGKVSRCESNGRYLSSLHLVTRNSLHAP